jgi:hypothetical protein
MGDAGFALTGAGDMVFAALLPEITFADGVSIFGAGCGLEASDPPLAAGREGVAAICGPGLIPSPGNRMPQKPTAGSVNSNST